MKHENPPKNPNTDLVSIGVPVRNGAAGLDEALRILVEQSYRNLEIVISDNCSTDETQDICRKYQQTDARIRYFRQERFLGAGENFRFVLENSHADYFMWAAHDDRWSPNYVEVLLNVLQSDSGAILAFPDVALFNDYATWNTSKPIPYDVKCESEGRYWRKIMGREYIRSGYLHVYGLLRRRLLLDYEWPAIEIGPDRPLLFHLSCRGRFARAEGACFYCYKAPRRKPSSQRAMENFGRAIAPFPYTRLSWVCAKTGCRAERLEGRRRSLLATFLVFWALEARKKSLALLLSVAKPLKGVARAVGIR